MFSAFPDQISELTVKTFDTSGTEERFTTKNTKQIANQRNV
jgi:hypothetical protein